MIAASTMLVPTPESTAPPTTTISTNKAASATAPSTLREAARATNAQLPLAVSAVPTPMPTPMPMPTPTPTPTHVAHGTEPNTIIATLAGILNNAVKEQTSTFDALVKSGHAAVSPLAGLHAAVAAAATAPSSDSSALATSADMMAADLRMTTPNVLAADKTTRDAPVGAHTTANDPMRDQDVTDDDDDDDDGLNTTDTDDAADDDSATPPSAATTMDAVGKMDGELSSSMAVSSMADGSAMLGSRLVYGMHNNENVNTANSGAAKLARSGVGRSGRSSARKKSAKARRNPRWDSTQVRLLKVFFVKNSRPSKTQVEELSVRSGLSYKQVRQWFRNKRHQQKVKPHMTGLDSPAMSGDDDLSSPESMSVKTEPVAFPSVAPPTSKKTPRSRSNSVASSKATTPLVGALAPPRATPMPGSKTPTYASLQMGLSRTPSSSAMRPEMTLQLPSARGDDASERTSVSQPQTPKSDLVSLLTAAKQSFTQLASQSRGDALQHPTVTQLLADFPAHSPQRMELLRELVTRLTTGERQSLASALESRHSLQALSSKDSAALAWLHMESTFKAATSDADARENASSANRAAHVLLLSPMSKIPPLSINSSAMRPTGDDASVDPDILHGLKCMFAPRKQYVQALYQMLVHDENTNTQPRTTTTTTRAPTPPTTTPTFAAGVAASAPTSTPGSTPSLAARDAGHSTSHGSGPHLSLNLVSNDELASPLASFASPTFTSTFSSPIFSSFGQTLVPGELGAAMKRRPQLILSRESMDLKKSRVSTPMRMKTL